MTTVVVLLVGVVAVAGLVALLIGRHPGWTSSAAPLVSWRRSRPTRSTVVPGLVAWDADILAASTGGVRGRARLSRRLEPLVDAQLRDGYGVGVDDPDADALLGDEWAFLCGDRPPSDRPELSVEEAVTALFDRLGSGPIRGDA